MKIGEYPTKECVIILASIRFQAGGNLTLQLGKYTGQKNKEPLG